MFSLISLILVIAGLIKSSTTLLITSGIFALAGAIESLKEKDDNNQF